MLTGKGLFQAYDGAEILHGVDVSINAGSTTLLLGKSGSGKSTLLRTLSLIDPPRAGTIKFGERFIFPDPAGALPQDPPWPDFTAVLQQLFLWPHMTIRRNILLPAELRGKRVAEAGDICRSLGISEILDRYPNQVSVGQRQRAALARGLLLAPKILLIDEITSAQDVEHIALILDILRSAVRSGMGLLVISHHLGFSRQVLSFSREPKVVFLESGSISEAGGSECIENPKTPGFKRYLELSLSLR